MNKKTGDQRQHRLGFLAQGDRRNRLGFPAQVRSCRCRRNILFDILWVCIDVGDNVDEHSFCSASQGVPTLCGMPFLLWNNKYFISVSMPNSTGVADKPFTSL